VLGWSYVVDWCHDFGRIVGYHNVGGAWAVGDKSHAVAERLMPIVANGFAVASVNYRLIPSVRFPAPVHDVKAAVRWLRANAAEYGLDPDHIAIGGVSAGGHLASLTALTAGDAQLEGDLGDHVGISSAVGAVVAYCPTSDFLLSGGRNALETQILPLPETAALLGLDRIDDNPELARSASPRHRVHAGAPPHLILHGDRVLVQIGWPEHRRSPCSSRKMLKSSEPFRNHQKPGASTATVSPTNTVGCCQTRVRRARHLRQQRPRLRRRSHDGPSATCYASAHSC
jgi:acetyl esterase/lipase